MIERFGDVTYLSGELIKGKIVQQPFLAKGDFLHAVSVEFATFQRRNACLMKIEIWRDDKNIKTHSVKADYFEDNVYKKFVVDLELEKGQLYEIKIYSPDGANGNALTVKHGAPLHRDLQLKFNGALQSGELACLLHYGKDKDNEIEILPAVKTTPEFASKEKPELSIIIPTAKRLDHLKNCLDSLRAHTKNYELIVIVNTPETAFTISVVKLLNLYPNHTMIEIPNYAGYVVPCNMGAAISKGKYLCILNDDVIVQKDWLIHMMAALKADPKLAQVGPSMGHLKSDFSFVNRKTSRPYIEGWCFVVPRCIYEKLGLFDPEIDFAYCEDSDFSTNLIHHGYKIREVKANIVHIRHQTSKSSGNEMKEFTDRCEIRNKNFLRKKWAK